MPAVGVKMDAVPGKHNILVVEPVCCGVYYGQCAELCGVNHSFIPIVVEVISGGWFERWVAFTDWFIKGQPIRRPYWYRIFVESSFGED